MSVVQSYIEKSEGPHQASVARLWAFTATFWSFIYFYFFFCH